MAVCSSRVRVPFAPMPSHRSALRATPRVGGRADGRGASNPLSSPTAQEARRDGAPGDRGAPSLLELVCRRRFTVRVRLVVVPGGRGPTLCHAPRPLQRWTRPASAALDLDVDQVRSGLGQRGCADASTSSAASAGRVAGHAHPTGEGDEVDRRLREVEQRLRPWARSASTPTRDSSSSRIAYEWFEKMIVVTSRSSFAWVQSDCSVYIALPSPSSEMTGRSGQATAAPVATRHALTDRPAGEREPVVAGRAGRRAGAPTAPRSAPRPTRSRPQVAARRARLRPSRP